MSELTQVKLVRAVDKTARKAWAAVGAEERARSMEAQMDPDWDGRLGSFALYDRIRELAEQHPFVRYLPMRFEFEALLTRDEAWVAYDEAYDFASDTDGDYPVEYTKPAFHAFVHMVHKRLVELARDEASRAAERRWRESHRILREVAAGKLSQEDASAEWLKLKAERRGQHEPGTNADKGETP